MNNLVKRNDVNWLPSVLDEMFKNDWVGGTTTAKKIGIDLPAVNIQETEGNFLVEVAAPGKKREDFNIELENDILSISSEQKMEKESGENKKYTRKEFDYTYFKRAFSVPENVESEKISASYENGVLMINLPKKEEEKAKGKRMIKIS